MDALSEHMRGLGAGCLQLRQKACEQFQLLLTALPVHHSSQEAFRTGGWAAMSLEHSPRACDATVSAAGPAAFFLASVTLSAPVKGFSSNSNASVTNSLDDASTTKPVAFTCSEGANTVSHQQQPQRFLWRSTRGGNGGDRATVLPLASLTANVKRPGAGCGCSSDHRQRDRIQVLPEVAEAYVGGPEGGSSGQEQGQRRWQQQLQTDLSGTWIKNRERSDSMEPAMNLMRLNGIVRQAVKLVRGVQICQDPEHFTFTVFSIISWFKVKEVYPWSGEERHFRRRDLRRGKALGRVEPHGQQVHVKLRWNDPLGGQGTDHFRLVSPNELHIESVIHVAGQTAQYLTVYNRKPGRRSSQRAGEAAVQQQEEAGAGSISSVSSGSETGA